MFSNNDYTIRRPSDFDYDAAIAELEEQVRRKKYVTSRLAHFEVELARLTSLEESRRAELDEENADVAALQRISPALILYTLTGQKAHKLAREEAEALAAAARYETVKGELSYVRERYSELSAELRKLGNCERRLDELMEEKKRVRAAQDAAYAERTAELERAVKAAEGELLEIDQALDKGRRVLGIIQGISNQLEQAYSLTGADLIGRVSRYRGDFWADVEKHEHLDTAQALLEKLGQYMQDFAAELGDVAPDARDIPASVGVGNGTRTLDLFFDNIFTDFAVRKHIATSKEEMEVLEARIRPVVEALESSRTAKEAQRLAAEKALGAFVRQN